jgi:hypothetical protein
LDRLHNGAATNSISEDRDDDDEDERVTNLFNTSLSILVCLFKSDFYAPRKITSTRETPVASVSSKNKKPTCFPN